MCHQIWGLSCLASIDPTDIQPCAGDGDDDDDDGNYDFDDDDDGNYDFDNGDDLNYFDGEEDEADSSFV